MLTWDGSKPKSSAAGRSGTDGFRLVPAADVPHMTWKGYQAVANLEPETRALIGASLEYPVRPYENPYRLFEPPDRKGAPSQASLNLSLFRRVDPECGTVSYLVRAARALKRGTAVCFVGGSLVECWKVEPASAESEGYTLRARELHDYFDYARSGPDLLLHMWPHHNIARFVRDPSYRVRGEGANVALDLILHPRARLFALLLYTTEDVAAGDEVHCARFVGNTKRSTHQNMVLAARVSHFYHRWACALESAAIRAHLSVRDAHQSAQQAAQRSKGVKLLTPQEQRLHMRGVDPKQKSVPSPPPVCEEEREEVRAAIAAGRERERKGKAEHALYVYFMRRERARLQRDEPALDAQSRIRLIGERWNSLDAQQREQLRKEKEAEEAAHGGEQPQRAAEGENESAPEAATSAEDAPTAAASSPPFSTTGAMSPLASDVSSLSLAQQEQQQDAAAVAASDSAAAPAAAASSSSSALVPLGSDDETLGYAPDNGQSSWQIREYLMRLMDTSAAFRLSGCQELALSTFGSSVSQRTRVSLYAIESQMPDVLVIDGDKLPFDAPRMQRMLDERVGYDRDALEVREILSLRSPCRYFCPPWYRAFCVVSKRALGVGELLCIYSGEMEQTIQHRCSSYVYNLPTRLGVSHFGKEYAQIPDLMIDAAAKGGIGRFINDIMFRNGEYQDENAANIGVQWVYGNGMPHLVFYAKKPIAAGEELVSSYGQEFWDVMCRQSLRAHSAFFSYIRAYTSRLERLLQSANVPLPPRPDVVVERDPLFKPKPLAYDPPPEDSDDEEEEEEEEISEAEKKKRKSKAKKKGANGGATVEEVPTGPVEEEYTVEKIVGKRYESDGSVRYCIKWLHYDDSQDNTWEPLDHLEDAKEAVGEFERKLRRLGLDVGMEPLPEPDSSADVDMADGAAPAPAAATAAAAAAAADGVGKKKKRKEKAVVFRNMASTRKMPRNELTQEDIDACIDLTRDDIHAAIAASNATSSSAPAAASSPALVSAPSVSEAAAASSSRRGRKPSRRKRSEDLSADGDAHAKRRSRVASSDRMSDSSSPPLSPSLSPTHRASSASSSAAVVDLSASTDSGASSESSSPLPYASPDSQDERIATTAPISAPPPAPSSDVKKAKQMGIASFFSLKPSL